MSLDTPNDPPRLYSYCLRWDDGAAPNPFWKICTLVICKPRIRKFARKGDWIVGTGPKHSNVGDLSGRLVYAMRVDEVMTLADYDQWARRECPGKIPQFKDNDARRRRGDAIYDFSTGRPKQRASVHGAENERSDLSGLHALVSRRFFYFGRNAIKLPARFAALVHQTQGEKYRSNHDFFPQFLEWVTGLGFAPNKVHGKPATWEDDSKTDSELLSSCRSCYEAMARASRKRTTKAAC
jgi:hypothetical protein